MAEKKNFTIENYNGTDYDTLYPQTNSGQVLLDSGTQEKLGLESGTTLNDAFNSISNGEVTYKVGDTLTTARTNLDNKWLLCNGTQVSGLEYPELQSVLPFKQLDWSNYAQAQFPDVCYNMSYQPIAVDNDVENPQYFFKYVKQTGTSSQKTYTITRYFIRNFNTPSTWIQTSSTRSSIGDNAYEFIGDYWFETGRFTSSSLLYYAPKNITDFSNFKAINDTAPDGSVLTPYRDHHVVYNSGKYFVYLGDKQVAIYDDITSAPKQIVNISARTSKSPLFFAYEDGVAVIDSLYDSKIKFAIIHSDGSMETQQSQIQDASYMLQLNGYIYYIVNSINYVSICRLDSFASSPRELYNLSSARGSYAPPYLDKTNNRIIFSEGLYLDSDNTLKQWTVNPVSNIKTDAWSNVVMQNGKYFFAVQNDDKTQLNWYCALTNNGIHLPSVSNDRLYTYIKAKS